MKYCTKCKKIYSDSETLCLCETDLKEISDTGNITEILLITVPSLEKDIIIQALSENEIAYRLKPAKVEKYASEMSRNRLTSFDVYIDISDSLKARKVLNGINKDVIYQDMPSAELEKFELSQPKTLPTPSLASRILGIILLLVLISLAVFGTDFIVNFVKNLFN